MDDFAPRPLAAASFGEQDAGSGPIHSSPSLGPITPALHNISARHLHEIGTSLPDDRQFLRSWRRQLNECLTTQQSRLVRFLLADAPPSLDQSEITRRCLDVLSKYSRPTWNFASSIRDLSLSTNTDAAVAAIEADLGISPAALRETMKRAVRMYVNAGTAVVAAESRLEEKLKRLETITGRINDLMFLEPTAELEQMAGPTRMYIESVLQKITLEEDYRDLVEQYKRFVLLRSMVNLSSFQRAAVPQCTICMAKEVSQAMTPCGHTFCDDCCGRQMTACYICRVQIRDKVRLFFG